MVRTLVSPFSFHLSTAQDRSQLQLHDRRLIVCSKLISLQESQLPDTGDLVQSIYTSTPFYGMIFLLLCFSRICVPLQS